MVSRKTPLSRLVGQLNEVYGILNMDDSWKMLAAEVTNRRGLPKFPKDYQFVMLSRSPNPTQQVVRAMYSDNRDVEFLLNLLEKLELYRAANHIRGFLGESPILLDNGPAIHPLQEEASNAVLPPEPGTEEFGTSPVIAAAVQLPIFAQGQTVPVPYEALRNATNHFGMTPLANRGHWLGEGGFADVFYAEDPVGTGVAIKRLRENSELTEKQFKAEVTSLIGLHHPNILPVLGYSTDGPHRCIVYKFAPLGSLRHRIACSDKTLPLSVKTRISIAKQTAEALLFLHANGLMHRDVTCANILLDIGYVVQLGDFGQMKLGPPPDSNKTSVEVSKLVCTQVYTPIEAVYVCSSKMDVYAYGMVLLVILTGLKAFDPEREDEEKSLKVYIRENFDDIMEVIDTKAGTWSAETARDMYQLALRCLAQERHDRPSMIEIIDEIRAWPEEDP